MTDLLTHVLAAYVCFSLLAWRTALPHRFVPLGMAGATLPDLTKVAIVVPPSRVSDLVGVPFSWLPFHRVGGVLAAAAVVTVFFKRDQRRTALAALLSGAGSHLVLDGLIERAHGLSPPYLYPVTWWQPPAGTLYISSDAWPAAVALAAATVVFLLRRRATGA